MTILTSGAFRHNLYYSMRNVIKTGLLLLKSYTVPEFKVSSMYSINNYCQWDVLSSIAKHMFTLGSTRVRILDCIELTRNVKHGYFVDTRPPDASKHQLLLQVTV